MKQIIILAVIASLAIGCKKATTVIEEAPTGIVTNQGSFTSNGRYTVTGAAKIITTANSKSLRLENFSTSNGPDLKVYLATTTNAAAFVNVATLKATNGDQNYDVPAGVDLSQYKYVLIWCQQFSALFGSAELK